MLEEDAIIEANQRSNNKDFVVPSCRRAVVPSCVPNAPCEPFHRTGASRLVRTPAAGHAKTPVLWLSVKMTCAVAAAEMLTRANSMSSPALMLL
jgi:hypothetical protein